MRRSTRYRSLAAVAAGVLLLSPAGAHAEVTRTGDEPWYRQTTVDIRRAKVLFAEAVDDHMQLLRGDARELYAQALVLWDNPDIRWNLALVLEDLGQYLHAYQQLERVFQWGDAVGAERLRDVRNRMVVLETRRLSRIEAASDEPGAEITLDGQPWFRGAGRHSVLVEPGQHYTVARKAGFFSVTRPVTVAAGEAAQVALPMDEDRLLETRRWAAWKPWAVTSLGGVITAAGAALERQAIHRRDAAARSISGPCLMSMGCTPAPAPRGYSRAVTESRVAIGALVAGGTMLAVGLTMAWLNQVQVHRTEARAVGPVEITPVLATNEAGLSVQLKF